MNLNKLEQRFGADFSEFEKKIIAATKTGQEFGREMVNVGKSMTAAVTVPIMAAGTAAVTASETIDDALDRIRIGTGQTGDNLDHLSAIFRDVMSEVPESAQAVSEAITEINKRTDAAGDELVDLSTQMLELSRISGSEVKPLIEDTQKAFASWGVETKNQTGALDFLWKVSQSTGVGVNELSQLMTASGSTMRALGIDFEHGAVLLGQFHKAGVDGGTVMAGLTKAATAFAKEGKSMTQGLGEVLAKIKEAPDSTKAAQIATEYFGKSSIAMADAVRRGALNINDMVAALKASPETIHQVAEDTAGLGEAFGRLQNKITLALEPLGAAITRTLIDVINAASAFVDRAIKPLIAAFGQLPQSVQTAVVVFGMIVAAIGPALVALGGIVIALAKVSTAVLSLKATAGPALTAISALFPSAAAAMTGAWASVTAAFAGGTGMIATAAGAITTAGAAILQFIGGPVTLAVAALVLLATKWDWLHGHLTAVGGLISKALSAVWSGIKTAAGVAWDGIKALVTSAASGVSGAALAVFGPLWTRIREGFTSLTAFTQSAWESLKSGAGSAGSWVISKLEGVASSVGGILADIWSKVTQYLDRIDQAITGAGTKAASVGSAGRSLMEFDGSVNDAIRGAASAGSTPTGAPTISTPGVVSGGSILPGTSSSYGVTTPKAPAPGASVNTTLPWNQSGTREIIDPYNLPNIQGGRGGPSGRSRNDAPAVVDTMAELPDWIQIRDYYEGPPVVRPTFTDPYLAAGQRTLQEFYGTPVPSWGPGSGLHDKRVNPFAPNSINTGGLFPMDVPRFADGGIVTKPTIGLVGEAGPEAIIPLSRARGAMGPPVIHVHVHANGSVVTQRDLADQVRDELVRNKNRNVTNGVAS